MTTSKAPSRQDAADDAAYTQAADGIKREAVKYRQYSQLAEQLDAIGSLTQARREAQKASEQAIAERDVLTQEVKALKEAHAAARLRNDQAQADAAQALAEQDAQAKAATQRDIDAMLRSAQDQTGRVMQLSNHQLQEASEQLTAAQARTADLQAEERALLTTITNLHEQEAKLTKAIDGMKARFA